MNWTEIKIEVNSKDSETAQAVAHMTVPYGIYIEDYSNLESEVMEIANINLIDEDLLKRDRTKTIIHVYIPPDDNPAESIAFLTERYNSLDIKHNIISDYCKEEDWLNNWKKYFRPIKIGKKLLIRPSWYENYNTDERVVLNIDPGAAFGTGTHETTRLCLTMIEKYINKNSTVLDVGCGSGILSVASLLLGAKNAVGVDIDEMAVKTSRENARINGVSEKMQVVHGNLTEKVSGKYDIIAANIVADIIIPLSKNIKNYMNADSVYIMSGIIDSRADDVKHAIEPLFNIIEELSENGWYCFVAKAK